MEPEACETRKGNKRILHDPFLRKDRLSDHVENGDTVYMVYDLQRDK
jgi:hypothetical protein